MKAFLRRHSLILSILTGLIVLFGIARGIGEILGPATCRDGWASSSIGSRGACSWHGGVDRSRNILILPNIALAWFAARKLFLRLNPPPPPRPVDPASYGWCPKCRGPVHWDREQPNLLRCTGVRCARGQNSLSGLPACRHLGCFLRLFRHRRAQCGAGMLLRKARRGRSRGKHFMGCSRYPSCFGTRRIDIKAVKPPGVL